jgi:hypothetical protein
MMVVERSPPAIDATAEGSASPFGASRAVLSSGRNPCAAANTAIAPTAMASTSPTRRQRGEALRIVFDRMMILI